MTRILVRTFVLLFLALLIAAAAYFFIPFKTQVVTAELRVHFPQTLLSPQTDDRSFDNRHAELDQYAATIGELLRSRIVVTQALRSKEVKDLQIVRAQKGPETFLRKSLQIERSSPGTIEVSLRCRKGEGRECATIVNAVIQSFLNSAEQHERKTMSDRLQTLKRIHDRSLEELKRNMDELESLSETLGTKPEIPAAVAMNPVFFRRSEAMITALADEIARLRVSLIVDEEFEQQQRQETLQRLEAEYKKQREQLESEFASRARISTPRKFVAVELKQRDIERLQQEIDKISEAIFQAEIDLESRGRIELISPAMVPR